MANQGPESRKVAGATGPTRGTVALVDALGAVVHTEMLCARALWAPRPQQLPVVAPAFDEPMTWLGHDLDDARAAIAACEEAAGKGLRVAAVLSARALAEARAHVRRLVDDRRAVVLHVVVGPPGRCATPADYADVHALADLGVGVLVARDAQDAADLTIVAHRASEDAEAPILVVHDGFPSSWARDRVLLPDAPLVRAALEPAPPLLASSESTSLPGHRRAAGRIPFALSSAMRAFERLGRRRLDAIDAYETSNAEIILVCAGAMAETARAVVDHARGSSPALAIGLVQVVSLRPFPGPQLVKAVGRARSVAVIERIDMPLAQSGPLAVAVKAAFADALTWTPGYPGIGRIPVVFSGSIDPTLDEATPSDLLAIVDNLLLGEHGSRVFHLGGEHPHGGTLNSSTGRGIRTAGTLVVRARVGALGISKLATALADAYGRNVRATPLADGESFDIVLSPDPIHAHHTSDVVDVLALASPPLAGDLEALRDGGAVVLARGATDLDAAAKAGLRARNAKQVAVKDDPFALLGGILRVAPPAGHDRAQLLADVERSLQPLVAGDAELRAALVLVSESLDAATSPA